MVAAATVRAFEDERQAFVALADGLEPAEWELPSWCAGWSVREVVEHVAFHIHRHRLADMLGPTEPRTARMLDERDARSVDGLLTFLRLAPPRRAASLINVCELVIHREDVEGARGATGTHDPATVRACLDFCTTRRGTVFVVARRAPLGRGLRLESTDDEWAVGAGATVRGPSLALLIAIAGRRAALIALDGAGVGVLARRLDAETATSA
jgi:uncharacterized protein (TIGR03083 family)